jgi:hypothetical protein
MKLEDVKGFRQTGPEEIIVDGGPLDGFTFCGLRSPFDMTRQRDEEGRNIFTAADTKIDAIFVRFSPEETARLPFRGMASRKAQAEVVIRLDLRDVLHAMRHAIAFQAAELFKPSADPLAPRAQE